jgi:peptidoglycan/LPS O-acetylase OafA/YrhL
MSATRMPRIHVQATTQLAGDSYQSLWMALLRGLAALEVAAAHARSEFFPGLAGMDHAPLAYRLLAFATGYAHQAVVVFFVISGWLVGGSLLNKMGQPDSFKSYAIDRVSRLWTVLIPTFALTLLIGLGTGSLRPALDFSTVNSSSASAFAGNLLGLQTILFLPFGNNYPLWSLSNETWYYLLFPLGLVCCCPGRTGARAAAALCLLLIGALLPFPLLLYFLLWLLGAGASRLRLECARAMRWGLFVLLAAIATYHRIAGLNDDLTLASFRQDLLLSVALVLFLACLHGKTAPHQRRLRTVRVLAERLAEFSFSLYVLHVPLLHLMQSVARPWGRARLSPFAPLDYALYTAIVFTLVGSAYLFYLLFESHTYRVRRLARAWLIAPGAGPGPAAGGGAERSAAALARQAAASGAPPPVPGAPPCALRPVHESDAGSTCDTHDK